MGNNKSDDYRKIVKEAQTKAEAQAQATEEVVVETVEEQPVVEPVVEETVPVQVKEESVKKVEVKKEKEKEEVHPAADTSVNASMAHNDVIKVIFIRGISRNTRTVTAKKALDVMLSDPFNIKIFVLNGKADKFVEYVSDTKKTKIPPQLRGYVIRQLKLVNRLK